MNFRSAESQFGWGMRLVLVTDPAGVPVGYTIVAFNEKEYEPVRELTTAHPGCALTADKGLCGRTHVETLALQERHDPHTRSGAKRRQPRLSRTVGQHLPRDRVDHLQPQVPDAPRAASGQDIAAGLAQRIVQRLLALTIGMLLNTFTGRPPRALVAYDGP